MSSTYLSVLNLILCRNELSEEHSAQLLSTLIVRHDLPLTIEADLCIAPSRIATIFINSNAQSQLNVSSVFHQTHFRVEPVSPEPCCIVFGAAASTWRRSGGSSSDLGSASSIVR